MGIFGLFKSKKEAKLETPPPPPLGEGELPEFPEIPKEKAVKEVIKKPKISIEQVEKEAVRKEKIELEEKKHLRLTKPIFVNVKDYRDVIDELGLVKNIMKEEIDVMARIEDFKVDEDKEFERWQKLLSDVQKKLIFIDKTLFG